MVNTPTVGWAVYKSAGKRFGLVSGAIVAKIVVGDNTFWDRSFIAKAMVRADS